MIVPIGMWVIYKPSVAPKCLENQSWIPESAFKAVMDVHCPRDAHYTSCHLLAQIQLNCTAFSVYGPGNLISWPLHMCFLCLEYLFSCLHVPKFYYPSRPSLNVTLPRSSLSLPQNFWPSASLLQSTVIHSSSIHAIFIFAFPTMLCMR